MTPHYVSLYLGAGADFLHLLGADLVPLVSWMGGKRRDAHHILRALGLLSGRVVLGQRVGERVPCLLSDLSWWGWVWPVVLCPVDGPRVEYFLRSWRGEDPRALWFRLRDLGPVTDDVAHAAAQLLWLQARAASGVPVWWEGAGTWRLGATGWEYSEAGAGELTKWDRTRRGNRGPANQAHAAEPELLAAPGDGRDRQVAYERSRSTPRLLQEASTQIDDAGQRQACDPRLLRGSEGSEGSEGAVRANAKGFTHRLRAQDGRGVDRDAGARTSRQERLIATTRGDQGHGAPFEAGHKGTDSRGGGGIMDPGTIAARIAAVRERLHGAGDRLGFVDIVNADARAVTEEWAGRIGAAGRVYLDPPYVGKTGYPANSPRADVLWIAEEWARHGARVVLSEAVGLASELGAGWSEMQLRDGEWITCWGCDLGVAMGAA